MSTLALCIPAYNASNYLPRLLLSAKNQAIPFDEIIVYNDCSGDDTAKVAEHYGAKVINGDVNQGCSFGKNVLAEKTSCQWIHFHDADDELLPNFTLLAHKWMNYENCPDVVLFDYEYRDNDTHELLFVRKFDKENLENDPISYAIQEQINPFCGLYKKDPLLKIGGYDIDPLILYNEDKAFHIKLAINNLTFSVEKEISIINYRVGSSMSVTNQLKCALAQYHVLANIAVTHGELYPIEISNKLWENIASLAAAQNWKYVKMALALANKLGHPHSNKGNTLFNALTHIDPFRAVWLREKMIRLLKPQLRKNG